MSVARLPPIFVIGVHRSGTTLLRYMLSSSPRIFIPPESDFIPYFFLNRANRMLGPGDVERILDIVFGRYRFVRQWKGERPTVGDMMAGKSSMLPSTLLDRLYTMYAGQYGATRWGDKTPIYTLYIDLIDELFPDSQIINLVRDGRDVALSTLDKWGTKKLHVDSYYSARNWARRVPIAHETGRALGEQRYFELKYEQLVTDPEYWMRAICEFLDEPFVAAMVRQDRFAKDAEPVGGFHEPVRKPPNPSRVGRWKSEMSSRDLRLFQRVAGRVLIDNGYPVEDAGSMPAAESVRYYFLKTKYWAMQSGRSVLQKLGLKPPI